MGSPKCIMHNVYLCYCAAHPPCSLHCFRHIIFYIISSLKVFLLVLEDVKKNKIHSATSQLVVEYIDRYKNTLNREK